MRSWIEATNWVTTVEPISACRRHHGADFRTRSGRLVRDLERVSGRRIKLFRPPYGAHGLRSLYMVKGAGMQTVLWSVDSEDWKGLSAEDPLQHTASKIARGGILLLHDRPATDTVEGDQAEGYLPKEQLTRSYLVELAQRGLKTVSLAELLDGGEEIRRAKVAK